LPSWAIYLRVEAITNYPSQEPVLSAGEKADPSLISAIAVIWSGGAMSIWEALWQLQWFEAKLGTPLPFDKMGPLHDHFDDRRLVDHATRKEAFIWDFVATTMANSSPTTGCLYILATFVDNGHKRGLEVFFGKRQE